MGIDVEWVDAELTAKQQVFDPRGFLTTLAISSWHERGDSVCLRFINPWGSTIFNHLQAPLLLAELVDEVSRQHDSEIKAQLQKVIRLVELAVRKGHMYVRFVGD